MAEDKENRCYSYWEFLISYCYVRFVLLKGAARGVAECV